MNARITTNNAYAYTWRDYASAAQAARCINRKQPLVPQYWCKAELIEASHPNYTTRYRVAVFSPSHNFPEGELQGWIALTF